MPALTFGVSTNFALANFLASSSLRNVSVALVCARFRRRSSNETYHVPRDLLAMRPSRGLRRRLGAVGDKTKPLRILHFAQRDYRSVPLCRVVVHEKKKAHAVLVLALAITSNYRKSDHQQFNPFRIAPRHSLHDLIFECHASGVIFLEPSVRSFFVRKNFEMAGVANMVSGIDVNPNGRHWSLFFRRPRCFPRATDRHSRHPARKIVD